MAREESIIELGSWLQTAPGRQALAWEQAQIDRAVADAFGFHALQLGLPEMDGLRANRMPHRWIAHDALSMPEPLPAPDLADDLRTTLMPPGGVSLHCEFDALPFPDASLDLVVMPHALELSRDPHQTLREVERVLVPEGRVVLSGFNPKSLWALRHGLGGLGRRLGAVRETPRYLPGDGGFISYRRLRDWLRLLGFEVEAGRFGCWRPALHGEGWLARFEWMDRMGDRWWPGLGAVYLVTAVKRVQGMRLVGLARRTETRPRAAATASVVRRSRPHKDR